MNSTEEYRGAIWPYVGKSGLARVQAVSFVRYL